MTKMIGITSPTNIIQQPLVTILVVVEIVVSDCFGRCVSLKEIDKWIDMSR